MYKSVLALTLLLFTSISLFAIDMNETSEIIEEATKATKAIQDDFETLINKPEKGSKKESIVKDENITQAIVAEEIITVIESNETLITTQETPNNELNITTEEDEEEGSITRGLIIFKTNLKVPCDMTGEEFAKNYTQEDWDDIYENKEFEKIVTEICPKIEGHYQEEWTPHLYQFSLKYASDSDEIPEC